MDVPTANQSQTPCQPWVGQNGWSPASPQGPPCNPLPSFQHLSLGSPSDQRPCYDHLQTPDQSCQSDLTTFSSRNNTHHSTIYANNADQSVQRNIPDVLVSSSIPATSQGRSIPPCSLPLIKEGAQPCKPHQMLFHSPYSPYQAISPHFQSPYTHPSLNGPQSPHQKHLPVNSPSFGQCANQSPQCAPQPAFDRANLESSVGYTHDHAPTSPIQQQQPQWTLPPHSKGRFIVI